MKRREPPPIATWMLGHLTAGDRDVALAGDLLEDFSLGRSDGWYWRQVAAACAISWSRSLRTHMQLLLFALLWSMLAPAWEVICNRIQGSPMFTHTWQLVGGLWVLPAFAMWTVLHSLFLWCGILIFIASHGTLGKNIRSKLLERAFLLAPFIFLPLIATTFVLMNLYSYPGLIDERLATTPLGQIADLKMAADVLRIPYFFALLCSLWGAVPRSVRTSRASLLESIQPSEHSDSLAHFTSLNPFTLKRFFGLMIAAGLVNAMIAGFLLCRLPPSHAPGISSLAIRAILYIAGVALAGNAGTWLYWRNPSSPFRENPPLPFALFALICSAGWVWVPSIVIFSEQISAASCFTAIIGAFVLASGLAPTGRFLVSAVHHPPSSLTPEAELFFESLQHTSWQPEGYIIAMCLYAASFALLTGSVDTASALFACGVFIFTWKASIPASSPFEGRGEYKRYALRLTGIAIPAVFLTIWALLDGVAHRNQTAQGNAALTASDGSSGGQDKNRKVRSDSALSGLGGYESVVLWPYPEKKQIIPPLPVQSALLAPGTTKPLIIRFDGPYWYTQPPEKRPGPAAHQAHGTPVAVDIQSNNSLPLVMEAHQYLSEPVPIVRCREIQVEVESRDNAAGAVSLVLLLSDGTSQKRPALHLGQQPILSTEPGHFSIESVPIFETLPFAVPSHPTLKRFDEITVLFLPDVEHSFRAPKIALQQFQLFPR